MSVDLIAVWLHISQMLALGTPTHGLTAEQPMPRPGRTDVTPVARSLFLELLAQRERKGIETYGTTLQTDNGRDAIQDALEEATDLWQYLIQVLLERNALVTEHERLRAELARLRGELAHGLD